jgi:hypothetical protein
LDVLEVKEMELGAAIEAMAVNTAETVAANATVLEAREEEEHAAVLAIKEAEQAAALEANEEERAAVLVIKEA